MVTTVVVTWVEEQDVVVSFDVVVVVVCVVVGSVTVCWFVVAVRRIVGVVEELVMVAALGKIGHCCGRGDLGGCMRSFSCCGTCCGSHR